MEIISRHELVPFTALMNMIKFNYLEKKEVFQTLLGVLCDYDPTDDENKKRTTRYIELLLSEQSDLAEYLLSFLPNGLSVDHIGMAEIKDDQTKLKLKKKKPVKLYQATMSQNNQSIGTWSNSLPAASIQIPVTTQGQTIFSNRTQVKPANLNFDHLIASSATTPNLIYSLNSTVQGVGSVPKVAQGAHSASGFLNTELDYSLAARQNEKTLHENKSKPNNCQLKTPNCILSTAANVPNTSVQVLPSNMPLLYVNNAHQAPVCPVMPSMKLQMITPQGNRDVQCNVNTLYPTKQQHGEWRPAVKETSNECYNASSQLTAMNNVYPYQNSFIQKHFPGFPTSTDVQSTQNVNNSNVDLTKQSYDLEHYNNVPESIQYIHQHDSVLPSLRFPLHSTPRPHFTVNNVSVPTNQPGHDLLSIINQPLGEHTYQPITEVVQSVNANLYSTSRNLSSFPYTHEFVFPNGKTQNLHVNRSSVHLDQTVQPMTSQNNLVIKPIIRQQPGTTYGRCIQATSTRLPVHNATNVPTSNVRYSQVSTAVFNPNQIPQILTPSLSQPQSNVRPFLTPTQNNSDRNLNETPQDMLTPIQYNQELNMADPIQSGQSADASSLNKIKPKKLSMSANSAVRKKLRLTPNNSNNIPI